MDQMVNAIGTKGKPGRRLAVAYIFAYLDLPIETTKTALTNLLQLSVANDVPVIIELDGVSWWSNRPELWNFWDAGKPGYNPANIDNVERFDWGTAPDKAVKIGWRDWGSQLRVAPAPNLASPKYRAAQTERLNALLPIIKTWYDGLPADKKYLFGGLVFGLEFSPYIQAWYYEGGNDLLNQPPENDPSAKWWQADGSSNILPLGYAAAQTLNLPQKSGYITPETVEAISKSFLEFQIQTAIQHGIDPKRIITHTIFPGFTTNKGGGHTGVGAISDVTDVVPGWTTNQVYRDPTHWANLISLINKLDGRPWAAIELNNPERFTADYLKEIMNYKNNRYTNIIWAHLSGDSERRKAVKEMLEE